MWAAITPYAKEWFSDTVAGSALGHLAGDACRGENKNAPTVAVGRDNVALVWFCNETSCERSLRGV